jgi:DNA ligase (NAD+)
MPQPQTTGIREEIISLNARLTEASESYYKRNQSIMSDAEFDTLERRLKQLVSSHPLLAYLAPILTVVGSDATGGRIPHAVPMLSIENKYEEADLLKWYASLPEGTGVCLEPKFDGISASLRYKDGYLVQALTRGDGESGEDITHQVYATGNIPMLLADNMPANLEIRGELVMKNSTLERINREAEARGGKTYSSTRNLTGGTMKLKDTSLIPDRDIQFMPWDVIGSEFNSPSLNFDSGVERLQSLIPSGFPRPLGRVVYDAAAISQLLKQKLEERTTVLRDKLSLETDGVVIKVDSHALRQKLGVGNKYTNYQVCFKPQSASGTTYLRDIEWQVGRTGKVSPVAVCDPVVLAGAKIEHASLNNITWIREKELKLGAKVEILRSGDVIPQIVKVLDEGSSEIFPPTVCPECHTVLEESDEGGAGILISRCTNTGCPGRTRGTLAFIGSREVLEIDGLGPEMARLLVLNGVENIDDLYEFQAEALDAITRDGEEKFLTSMRNRGFDVTVLKMVNSLETAKTTGWERWIKALCIPMIGETLGKTIATVLGLTSEDMASLTNKLLMLEHMEVEGLGEAKIGSIIEWANDASNVLMCSNLFENGVRPKAIAKPKESAPLSGVIFCITGSFEEDRGTITKKLESLGAVAKPSVSKKINLLIVGEDAGSKLDKAEALGIRIEKADWLTRTLTENGL